MKSRTPNTTSKPMMKITTTIQSAALSILGSHAIWADGPKGAIAGLKWPVTTYRPDIHHAPCPLHGAAVP